MQNEQKRGWFLTAVYELVFVVGVFLALVLTIIDVPLGILRFVVVSLWNRRPHFPWQRVAEIWRLIGAHFGYWFSKTADESSLGYRAGSDLQRDAMRVRASKLVPGGSLPRVELVNVFQFFAMLPGAIGFGIFFVHVVVSTFVVFSLWHVYQNRYGAPELTGSKPEYKVQHVPRVDEQQQQDFGPWFDRGQVLDKVGQPGFQNVVMLSDTGSMEYSQTKVADPLSFSVTPFHERVVNPHLTENGQVAFRDQLGKQYTVNPNQAFLFAGYASKFFMFNSAGGLMTAPASEVKFKN